MTPAAQELTSVLDDLANILESHGDQYWVQWIRSDASKIKAGDIEGIRHLLTAYGGMGSLNDRYLCPQNGDRISEADTISVNAILSQKRSRAWTLAHSIKSLQAT